MDNTQGLSETAPTADASQVSTEGQAGTTQEQVPSTEPKADNTADSNVVGADQTQTPAEDKSGEGEDLIAGKFKSNEDLVKAYQELESHNKKVEMENKSLKDYEEMFYEGTPENKPAPIQTAAQVEGSTQKTPEEQAREILSPMIREEFEKIMTPTVAKFEVRDMVSRYGDRFKGIASKVAARKKANPSLSLEDAFKLEEYSTIERTARNEGIAQATQTAEQKVKAQVESSQPSGYKPASIEDAVKDKKVRIEEIAEVLGPEFNAFAETSRRKQGKN